MDPGSVIGQPPAADEKVLLHEYLSTGCLHGQHDYCRNPTGAAGAKKPASCKFCDAPCRCACHARPRPAGAYTTAADLLDRLPTQLQLARRSRGLTMRQVADMVGCSASTVHRIEAGDGCALSTAVAVLRWLEGPPGAAPARTDAESASHDMRQVCGKCRRELTPCLACDDPGLCGEKYCAAHLPDEGYRA